MKCIYLLATALLLSLLAQAQPEPAGLYKQTSEINDLMVKYQADYGSISRFYAIPSAPETTERLLRLHQDYLQQISAIDFEALPTGSRVDYLLFSRDLKEHIRVLEETQKGRPSLQPWIMFDNIVYELHKQRRRGAAINGQYAAGALDSLRKMVQTSMQQLQQGDTLDKKVSQPLLQILEDMQEGLKDVYTFYEGYDPLFSWWTEQPYQVADSLLTVYAEALDRKSKVVSQQQKDKSGIVGVPIGEQELLRQLQYEMIPYTPEALIAIANREFAWCDKEMLKASQEMGFGKDWKAALEKVKNTYVPPGKQPEVILRLYEESVAFLKEKDLISIPPVAEETWRMIMMTPERQKVNPFFTGGEAISISYPTNTMRHEDKLMSMRGNNPHFSRATVHHELIAGHGLQFFMNDRYKTYRNFRTPFWTEGWALYWERLLWDLDFPASPEDRVGMLFWRMHRCARIIFSLNYHLGKWTPQQCIDFLVDRVGHEYANAEGEVRRSFVGGYSPLYQLAYMIGGLQFEGLMQELVQEKGMSYKAFHDAVMQQNSMPVEMLRAILLDTPPPKNFKTSWRFDREKK